MIRKPISKVRWWAFSIAAMVVVVLLYSWMSYRQKEFNPKDTTIPNATQFLEGIETLTKPDVNGDMWLIMDLRATYGRHLAGMLVGVILSLVIGLAMGCYTDAEAIFKFQLTCLSKIPPTAMIAVYFVLFGTELNMYVAMISLGIFPTLAMAVYQAARKDVTHDAIYKAYTLGASDSEVVWNVVFKQIIPRFLEAIRLTVGPAMVFLIAAEWATADIGFGYRLRIQSRLLNMNVVYIYLVILALTSYLMDWSLAYARRKMCPWFGE